MDGPADLVGGLGVHVGACEETDITGDWKGERYPPDGSPRGDEKLGSDETVPGENAAEVVGGGLFG